EDVIRNRKVTGFQTWALPILGAIGFNWAARAVAALIDMGLDLALLLGTIAIVFDPLQWHRPVLRAPTGILLGFILHGVATVGFGLAVALGMFNDPGNSGFG